MNKTLLRAGALSCALLASTALTSTALAQTGAPYRNLDANGVDLSRGDYLMQLNEGSIGSGRGRLSLVREQGYISGYNGHAWDSIHIYETGSSRGVNFGQQRYETFTGTNSSLANGATLTLSGVNYIHQASDGTVTTFRKRDPNCSTGPSGFCIWIPTSITSPDGGSINLNWSEFLVCNDAPIEEQTCVVDSVRLADVSNSYGYSIVFTYAADGATGLSAPSPSWFQRTQADFYNGYPSASSSATVTYSYPSTNVTDVTDMGGLTWRITGGSLVTGIRRPGASSDTTTISRSGYVTSVTRDGVTTNYSYSVSGSTGTMVVTDGLSNATTITSNLTFGRPTSVVDPLSRTTGYTYDSSGRLTRVTQPEGNYVEYSYDGRGNVTQSDFVPKSGSGLSTITSTASFDSSCSNPVTCNSPNSITDARGNTTSFTYDSTHGGVLTVTSPAVGGVSPQTRYSYSLSNGEYQLTAISACASGTASSCVGTSDESRTVIGYDSNGNANSVEQRDGTGALSATTTATHTALGDVETVDGPLSGSADTTRMRYNGGRQVIGVVSADPDGGGSLPHRAMRTTYTDGLPTSVQRGTVASQSDTDWAGFSASEAVETSYDANARPVAQRLVSGSTTYALTQTSYDALGRPECVARRMNSSEFAPSSLPSSACTLDTQGSDGPDRIIRTTRDNAGQVTLVQTGYGVSGVQADEVAATYTNNGRVETVTDGESNRTTYVYDGHDRLSRTRMPSTTQGAGTSSTTDYEELGYDAGGNVTSRRLRDGNSIALSYDVLNRLTTRDLPGSEPTVTLGYDLLGRMTSASDGSHSLSFTFDALGRNLTQVSPLGTASAQFDAGGRRTRLTYPGSGLYVDYDYLVTGDVSAIRENGATSGAGVLATYAFDSLGRRTSLTRGNGTVTSYDYDPVSRLDELAQNLNGTASDVTLTFSHNPASQIASASRSNDNYAYTSLANANVTDSHNGLNQLTANGGTSLTHDSRGNISAVGSSSYGYTSENMLVSAPGSVNLSYDPLLRLYQTAGSTTARFAYDGHSLIAEYDGSSSLQRRYVHGPGVDEPIVWYEGTGTSDRRWLHADERGSIIAASDGNGDLISSRNRYDDYGQLQGTLTGRFGYAGQPWLPEVSLSHNRARIYNPALGRFMQTDPIGFGSGMNIYAYVSGDPVNLTDPSGLAELGCWGSKRCHSDGQGIDVVGGRSENAGPGRGGNLISTGGPFGNYLPYLNPSLRPTQPTQECLVVLSCFDDLPQLPPPSPTPPPADNQAVCTPDPRNLAGALRTIVQPVADGADFVAAGLLIRGGPAAAGPARAVALTGRVASGLDTIGAAFELDFWGVGAGIAGQTAGSFGRAGVGSLRNLFGASQRYDRAGREIAGSVANRVVTEAVCTVGRGGPGQ